MTIRRVFARCAVIALLIASPTQAWWHHHVVYGFILPKDYVGWVRIDFEVENAPELDTEVIKTGGKATIIVPKTGIVETSSIFVSSTWESYELFYRDDDRLVPIPKKLYSDGFMLGGFSATLYDDSGRPRALAWYFMIGPKSLRTKHPVEDYLREGAQLPQPGPTPSGSSTINK